MVSIYQNQEGVGERKIKAFAVTVTALSMVPQEPPGVNPLHRSIIPQTLQIWSQPTPQPSSFFF